MAFPFYISIRGVQPYDYVDIHRIDRSNFISPISKEWFLFRIRHFSNYFYVATTAIRGDVVGFITGFDSPPPSVLAQKPNHWKYGFISRLAVEPAYRNLGIGDALLRAVENQFRREDRKGILISTRQPNLNARNFYSNRGYKHMQTFDGTGVYQAGSDESERTMIVMYKKLRE